MNYCDTRCRTIVVFAALVVLFAMSLSAQTVTPSEINPPFWVQWGLNPQHTLNLSQTEGQPLNKNLVNIIYDANVAQEQADPNAAGTLLVHYQVPLVDGNDVFIESKAGTYSNNTYSTQTWHQNKYTWSNGKFVKVWTFDTDWFAPGSSNDFWEPVYHAVLANGFLYDPGKGGTIFRINKTDGSVIKRINPFGNTVDPNTYTASPLSTDGHGNIFYNVVKISTGPLDSFFTNDVVDSWLVKVGPDDSISKVSYTKLLQQAVIKGVPAGEPLVPKANDNCKASFSDSQLPWPPSPDAQPPTIPCGTQRAALNIAPAIAPNGTIYTISRAHFDSRYAYLVAVNPNLTGKWAASFRGRLNDGCGVDLFNFNPGGANANGGCRAGSHVGVDPATNEPPPARVLDDSSSTPTIAPDGSIFYGSYTLYNWAQGHMLHYSATGDFLKAFNFGWDTTPAIIPHDNTYSVVIKNNHYSGGSYCLDPNWCPAARTDANPMGKESFFVSQLTPNLTIEWSFQNSNTQSCTRNPDGTLSCVSDHPNGFEWCVNAPVVDANGTVYANSEDGNLYAINPGGTLRQLIFQQLALGAAYTPVSLDRNGKIYSQNDGHLFVVGRGDD
ncbi:MAG TPA: hypothetical protein VHA33_00510 [Candidatus Angelobacter sp.]|jgi:hypothetical protein|nr:hypothetical protein [Candidatus Angelobacter sp.]